MTATQEKTGQAPGIASLAAELMQLDDLLASCMRCGFCLSVCPVYGSSMREADVARGKIALLDNLAHEITRDVDAVNDRLNRCLLCGSCQSNCPSGVHVMDIFLRARTIVAAYKGFSPLKKFIFRVLLARPKLFNFFLDFGGKFQGLFLRRASHEVGTSNAPLLKPVIGDRHFPRLPDKAFHSSVSSLNEPAGKSGLRVGFFPGCVADKMFSGVAEATLKVLRHYGVGVYLPEGQNCCGIPALASGDRAGYDAMVLNNMNLFGKGDFDYLVTPCATCAATIKEFWPKLMENYSPDEQERIKRLQAKTMDITQFLVEVLKAELPESAGEGKRVTYHDSCHLKKSLGVSAEPRKILKSLKGYDFVEMPEADRCCGSGGSFTLYHYDLSKDIGKRKRDNIVSVDAEVATAACPACMMQMMDALSQSGDKVQVKHVIELYADALPATSPRP